MTPYAKGRLLAMERVGRAINTAVREQDVTAASIAAVSGYTAPSFRRIQNGDSLPSAGSAAKIALALHLDLTAMLQGNSTASTPEHEELLKVISTQAANALVQRIGAWLLYQRVRADTPKASYEEKLGITHGNLAKLERGIGASLSHAIVAANAFGYDLSTLPPMLAGRAKPVHTEKGNNP